METWAVWAIAGIILLIVEIVTPGLFFFALLSVASFIAAVVAYFNPPSWVPMLSFFIASIVLIISTRPLLRKLITQERIPSNVDELIGKEALVKMRISPHEAGVIKVGGEEWKAEATEPIEEGSVVTIMKVEGTRTTVKKKD